MKKIFAGGHGAGPVRRAFGRVRTEQRRGKADGALADSLPVDLSFPAAWGPGART